MTQLSIGEYFLRLYRAEAEVLCRECEQIIEDNANREAQLAALENAQHLSYD